MRQRARAKPDVPRTYAILVCLGWVAVCLAYAYVREELPTWWRNYGGGIPYVLFWITFWFVVFPYRRCVLPISVLVTLFTCLLEFLQLWKPPWLMEIRATAFGAALLGSGFTWQDFPPYFMGGLVGYLMLRYLVGVTQPSATA